MTGCFLAAGMIVSLILQYAMWMMMTLPPGPPSFDERDATGPAAPLDDAHRAKVLFDE